MPSTPQPQPQPCVADDCWSDEPVGQCPLEPNSFCLAGLQCLACAVPLGMSPSLCNSRLSSAAFFCNHCGPTVFQAGGCVAWEHSSSGQAVYSCGGRQEGESIGASLGLFCTAMSASTQVGDLRVWDQVAERACGRLYSHDRCCACCHVPLSASFPRPGPTFMPICSHCSESAVSPPICRQVILLNPYLPSGEPVHIVFNLCNSSNCRLSRLKTGVPRVCAVPVLGAMCCPQFLPDFSFLSPIPCPSLHSEGPNPFLPGQPCLTTLHALDPPQESCCLSCGSYRPLGLQPDASVQQFLAACCKVGALRPSEALRRILRDALEYCPYCLLQWDSTIMSHKLYRDVPSLSVSGPSYFPLSFDSGARDLEPDCSSESLFCSAESAAIRTDSRDRCTPVVSVSRRTRRRRNRRLRLVGQLSPCDASSSGEASAYPYVHRGTENEHRLLSLDSLIEPLGPAQGAPKTPEEEVLSRRWAFRQEVVGRWPGGLGGPGVSKGQPPGSDLLGATGTGASMHPVFNFPLPNPCPQVGASPSSWPASPNPNLYEQTAVASAEPSELPASSPAVHLWSDIVSGLEEGCETTVVEAISALQDSGRLCEGTFEWTAADLAINSVQDSLPDCRRQAALLAARDVICNLEVEPARGPLQVLAFNATTWRSSLVEWCCERRPDLILVQETHLTEHQSATVAQHVAPFGYVASTMPAVATGRGGCSGGLAVLHRQHLDVRHVFQFSVQGAGILAMAMRVKGFDLFVVNVYLQSGEGFQSPVNSEILSHLIPFLKSVKGSFFVAGDFNDDLETLISTQIAEEARGVWLGPGEATITGGGQIDLALVSTSLAPITTVSLDWTTPFKPHAALWWSLDLGAVSTLVPQLSVFRPCEPNPQPFEPCRSRRPLVLLDLPVDTQLTQAFADLSLAAELSVFGASQGRGTVVERKCRPLQFQGIPQNAWGGRTASLWSRFLSWLKAWPTQGARGGSFIKSFLKQLDQVWHGPTSDCELFRAQVASLLAEPGHESEHLLLEATAQQNHHSKMWLQSQSRVYKKWLTASTIKGMRPLFRVVRKHEATFDRPFRDKSLLDRVYHRWLQWHEIWCQEIATDPSLFAKLKSKAVEQARDLQPIPLHDAVNFFRQFPCKAPGADGWTPQLLRGLPEPAIQAILDFFRECELCAEWPAQFAVNLIVLLPKSLKRERPIALLHILYRAYVRLRWPLVANWQHHYARVGKWDKAMPGSGVLDIALSRLVRGESARHHKEHLCTLFIDLETFYDRCRFADAIQSGLSLGYPPLILHQALLVYQAPRYLHGEGSLAPMITPTSGVLAGCPAAPSIAKLIIHPIAARLVERPGATNLDVWIDDLSLDSVCACPQQLASDSVRLYRGLAKSLCDMGAKISLEKTCFVTSSAVASRALAAVRRPDDPQIKSMARDLGVTSAGTRRRLLGLAATRRAKAGARSRKLNSLGVPGLSHRIRVVKSSIVSAGLWGHQSLGVSPKRRKWYRTLCGRHLGRQKLGSLDVVFALLESKCEDPHFTILRQHCRAVCRVFANWAANDPGKFESTWRSLWHHLQQAPSPWKRVTGPVSATIAYLMDLGVDATESRTWRHNQGALYLDWCSPDVTRSVWQWLVQILRAQQYLRISHQDGCTQLAQGIDCTVPRKLAKRSHLHKNTRTGLMAVWQGSLPGATKHGWCRSCRCLLTVQHALWDCPYLHSKFPDNFDESRSLYPWPSLWLRGLVPLVHTRHPTVETQAYGLREEGIFRDHASFSGNGLIFATDASGGPGGGDERMQFTCWAIGAYVLEPSGPQRLGCISYLQPFHMSVPQAEQQAVFELLLRVHDAFDVTIDCKSVLQLLKKSNPPIDGQVPWGDCVAQTFFCEGYMGQLPQIRRLL